MRSERYPVLWVGHAVVISAPAEIDAVNADELGTCLLSAIGNGARVLVVDMTATTFCDCAAVYAIMACWQQARAAGVSLRVVATTPAVRHVFTITGAALLIAMRPTVSAALIGD